MNGLVRGRSTKTTVPARNGGVRAADLLNRVFTSPRPNHAWVTDFPYVPTWSPSGTPAAEASGHRRAS